MVSTSQSACTVCLGEITDYGYLFECQCKKPYHLECAESVGKCVACEKAYDVDDFTEIKVFTIFINDARAALKKGNYERGLALIDFALKIEENSLLAWNLKGMVNAKLKRYEEALQCFQRVLVDETRSETYYNLACTLIEMKRLNEALECINMALSSKPNDIESTYLKGYLLSRLGNPQEAIACFNEVLKRKPQHTGAKSEIEKIQAKG